jgi:hypothetical protein
MTAQSIIDLVQLGFRAGIRMSVRPGGALDIRGPSAAGHLGNALRERQREVLALYGWAGASVGQPAPCAICRRPAILRDPVDGRPCHKTCADALLLCDPAEGSPRRGRV